MHHDVAYFPPKAMDVVLSLPEDVARRLREQWGDVSRRSLETVIAQAYREGYLTLGEVRRALGFASRHETEVFLHEAGAPLHLGIEDLERDAETLRHLRS